MLDSIPNQKVSAQQYTIENPLINDISNANINSIDNEIIDYNNYNNVNDRYDMIKQ